MKLIASLHSALFTCCGLTVLPIRSWFSVSSASGKLQPIVSVAFTPKGTAVTGGKLGGLYLWVGGTVKDKRRAHRVSIRVAARRGLCASVGLCVDGCVGFQFHGQPT